MHTSWVYDKIIQNLSGKKIDCYHGNLEPWNHRIQPWALIQISQTMSGPICVSPISLESFQLLQYAKASKAIEQKHTGGCTSSTKKCPKLVLQEFLQDSKVPSTAAVKLAEDKSVIPVPTNAHSNTPRMSAVAAYSFAVVHGYFLRGTGRSSESMRWRPVTARCGCVRGLSAATDSRVLVRSICPMYDGRCKEKVVP